MPKFVSEYPSTSTSKQYYIQLQDKEVEGVWEWKDERKYCIAPFGI